MKKAVLALMVSFLLTLLPQQLSGQMSQNRVEANISFQFQVGRIVLPPGRYIFIFDAASPIVRILDVQGRSHAAVFAQDVEPQDVKASVRPADQPRFIFKPDGNIMVLHRVLAGTSEHSHDLVHPESVSEL